MTKKYKKKVCLQISVIGIIGDGYKSDIAIDDIAFFPYPCFKETTTTSTTTVTETVTSTLTTFTTTATETASLATMGMTTKGTRNATSTSTKPMQDTTKLLTITTTTTDTEAATSSTPTGIISTETSTSTGLSATTNNLPTNFSATTTWDENSPSTEVRITDDSTTAHISPTTEPDSSRLLFKTTDVVDRTSSLLDLLTKTSSKNIITTDSTASISLDNSTSFENYSNSVTESEFTTSSYISIPTNESSISIWSKNKTVIQDTSSTTASVLGSSTTGSLIGTSDNDVEPTQVSLNHTAANSTAANSSATQTYDSQDLSSTSPHPSMNLLPTVTAAVAEDCNVTQPNICDYESSLEPCANQTGRWGVVSGIITPKGPTIDHTYGNNTGHYLLLGLQKVFDDWVTVWDPADAIITCDVCMRYYYSANMGLGGLLRFWQVFNDTRGVDATLVSVIENKTEPNDWTMVEATMRFVDHFNFHFVINNHVELLDNRVTMTPKCHRMLIKFSTACK